VWTWLYNDFLRDHQIFHFFILEKKVAGLAGHYRQKPAGFKKPGGDVIVVAIRREHGEPVLKYADGRQVTYYGE
jgi:hypothetical protein